MEENENEGNERKKCQPTFCGLFFFFLIKSLYQMPVFITMFQRMIKIFIKIFWVSGLILFAVQAAADIIHFNYFYI